MTDLGSSKEPPTYYANVVTSILTVDDLVLELRRIDLPHREMLENSLAIIPPATPADVIQRDPVARVVMTFSAAKALKEYLDNALPRLEEARKTGQPIA